MRRVQTLHVMRVTEKKSLHAMRDTTKEAQHVMRVTADGPARYAGHQERKPCTLCGSLGGEALHAMRAHRKEEAMHAKLVNRTGGVYTPCHPKTTCTGRLEDVCLPV